MHSSTSRRYRRNWQLFVLLNLGGAIFIASLIYKASESNSNGCRVDLKGQTRFRLSSRRTSRSESGPEIALLMSFPNSGTSFTLRHIRSATRTTTATNYAKETKHAKITNYSGNVPTVHQNDCVGCSLPMLHDSDSSLPDDYILVKTHCAGFAGQNLNQTSIITSREAFLESCVTPFHLVPYTNYTTRIRQVKACPYEPDLVKRVVHIMRSPLDNIVSRFHLFQRNLFDARKVGLPNINATADEVFPISADGFRKYCTFKDKELMQSKDGTRFQEFHGAVPCLSEFFLYIQWHNSAFHVTSGGIPVLFFNYEDFESSFNKTSRALLDFLHLEASPSGRIDVFQAGKRYADYYTPDEKVAIACLIDRFASKKTKEMLRLHYSMICRV